MIVISRIILRLIEMNNNILDLLEVLKDFMQDFDEIIDQE